jgi:hypothetical protein
MKTPILLIVMAGLAAPLGAETVGDKPYYGSGYAVLGLGSCVHGVGNVSVAAGGEGFLYRGLTLGGEIGHYRFVERSSSGFGIAGVNAGYHFVNRRRPGRVEPFVSGGLAAAFRSAVTPGVTFGGGVNYWFSRRVGVRLEGRGYGFAGEAIAKFGVGISFR